MEILKDVILALHIIGVAALLGGVLYQIRSNAQGKGQILPAMMHGAYTMLLTGLLLVGLAYPLGNGDFINNTKIAVKLVVLIALLVVAFLNRKRETTDKWVLPTIGALTVVNVLLATIW